MSCFGAICHRYASVSFLDHLLSEMYMDNFKKKKKKTILSRKEMLYLNDNKNIF